MATGSTERLRLALRSWSDPTHDQPRPQHWTDGRPTPDDVEPTVTLTEDDLAALVEEGALLAMERLVQDLSAYDQPSR